MHLTQNSNSSKVHLTQKNLLGHDHDILSLRLHTLFSKNPRKNYEAHFEKKCQSKAK